MKLSIDIDDLSPSEVAAVLTMAGLMCQSDAIDTADIERMFGTVSGRLPLLSAFADGGKDQHYAAMMDAMENARTALHDWGLEVNHDR